VKVVNFVDLTQELIESNRIDAPCHICALKHRAEMKRLFQGNKLTSQVGTLSIVFHEESLKTN
jgi:hypothetical protein